MAGCSDWLSSPGLLGAFDSHYRVAVEPTTLSICVIYVSWRDEEQLVRSVRALATERPLERSGARPGLVVVVNEDRGFDAQAVTKIWPGAIVIRNDENRGFGPACNQGAAAADSDILLFLNPDTLSNGAPIPEVTSAFLQSPSAVGVAPALDDSASAGVEQRVFQLRRLPSLLSDARELLLVDHILPANRWRRRARYLEADRSQPFVVEQAAAAALAVRSDAFERIGGFDERFVPAYWEDVDLCKRLGDHGEIIFWPDARFEHIGAVSAAELGQGAFLTMYYRNAIRYRAKHYSRFAQGVYRSLLVGGMSLRAVAVIGGIGHNGTKRSVLRGLGAVARLAISGRAGDPAA